MVKEHSGGLLMLSNLMPDDLASTPFCLLSPACHGDQQSSSNIAASRQGLSQMHQSLISTGQGPPDKVHHVASDRLVTRFLPT